MMVMRKGISFIQLWMQFSLSSISKANYWQMSGGQGKKKTQKTIERDNNQFYSQINMIGQSRILQNQTLLFKTILSTLQQSTYSSSTPKTKKTPFSISGSIKISFSNYLARTFKLMNCSKSCYVLALILLDRVGQANQKFKLEAENLHKLWMTALVVAAKIHEDSFYGQTYYSQVAGVKLAQLNKMEFTFLNALEFKTYISPETFEKYCKQLQIFSVFSEEEKENIEGYGDLRTSNSTEGQYEQKMNQLKIFSGN